MKMIDELTQLAKWQEAHGGFLKNANAATRNAVGRLAQAFMQWEDALAKGEAAETMEALMSLEVTGAEVMANACRAQALLAVIMDPADLPKPPADEEPPHPTVQEDAQEAMLEERAAQPPPADMPMGEEIEDDDEWFEDIPDDVDDFDDEEIAEAQVEYARQTEATYPDERREDEIKAALEKARQEHDDEVVGPFPSAPPRPGAAQLRSGGDKMRERRNAAEE